MAVPCVCPECPPFNPIIQICGVVETATPGQFIVTLCAIDSDTGLPFPAGFTYAWVSNINPITYLVPGQIQVTIDLNSPTLVVTVTVTHPTFLYCHYTYTFVHTCTDVDLTFTCAYDCQTEKACLTACINGNCAYDPNFYYVWTLPSATGVVYGANPNQVCLDSVQIINPCDTQYELSVVSKADACRTTITVAETVCQTVPGLDCSMTLMDVLCLRLVCPATVPLMIVISPTQLAGACYRLTVNGSIIGTFYTDMSFNVAVGATVLIEKLCDPNSGYWENFTNTGATPATSTTYTMPPVATTTTLNYFYVMREVCLDQDGHVIILPTPPFCAPPQTGTPVGAVAYKYWKQVNNPTPPPGAELYTGSINGLTVYDDYADAVCAVPSTCITPISGLRINSQNRVMANNFFNSNATGVFGKSLQSAGFNSNNEFSVELWVYIVQKNIPFVLGELSDQAIIAKQQGIHDGWIFRIVDSGLYGCESASSVIPKGFAFSLLQGDSCDPTQLAITYMLVDLPEKIWCHIVLVRRKDIPNNRTLLEIWYNGVQYDNGTQAYDNPGSLVTSQLPATTFVSPQANLCVGCDSPQLPLANPPTGLVNGSPGGGMNANIVIADVKIFQAAVATNQPMDMFNNGFMAQNKAYIPAPLIPSLKFHANFNEITGTVANDSFLGNNMNLSGYNGDTQPIPLPYGNPAGTYTYGEDTTTPFNNTFITGNPPFGNDDTPPVPAWVQI